PDLASVMRYVAHGVATGLTLPSASDAFTFEDSDQEAMLVTDRSGVIRHGSETARRLLLLATTSEINPASLKAAVNQRASAALNALCERLDAVARGDDSAPPVLSLDTKWGRHVLRAYWLDDDDAPDALIGVRGELIPRGGSDRARECDAAQCRRWTFSRVASPQAGPLLRPPNVLVVLDRLGVGVHGRVADEARRKLAAPRVEVGVKHRHHD